MSTIAEIEKAVPQLTVAELARLEQIVHRARVEKERLQKPSLRDIRPHSAGQILRPIGPREQWYDEMKEGCA